MKQFLFKYIKGLEGASHRSPAASEFFISHCDWVFGHKYFGIAINKPYEILMEYIDGLGRADKESMGKLQWKSRDTTYLWKKQARRPEVLIQHATVEAQREFWVHIQLLKSLSKHRLYRHPSYKYIKTRFQELGLWKDHRDNRPIRKKATLAPTSL